MRVFAQIGDPEIPTTLRRPIYDMGLKLLQDIYKNFEYDLTREFFD